MIFVTIKKLKKLSNTFNINKFHFQSNRILESLDENLKDEILSRCTLLKFRKGQMIFYDGGAPTGVYILKSGRAKIFKTGIYGKDQIFYIYKSGDIFGYHALLCDENYEDSCEAIEDCEILLLFKSDFKEFVRKKTQLKLLLIQNMSHEFGVLVNTITILAQKPLRERLATYLLILNERYAENEHDRGLINLSREDLANVIGTARESLGRLLKEFKEEGLIQINYRTITITDFSRMNLIANSVYSKEK